MISFFAHISVSLIGPPFNEIASQKEKSQRVQIFKNLTIVKLVFKRFVLITILWAWQCLFHHPLAFISYYILVRKYIDQNEWMNSLWPQAARAGNQSLKIPLQQNGQLILPEMLRGYGTFFLSSFLALPEHCLVIAIPAHIRAGHPSLWAGGSKTPHQQD